MASPAAPTILVRRLAEADAAAYKTLRDRALAECPSAFTSDAVEEASRPPAGYHGRFGIGGADPATFTLGAFTPHGALIGTVSAEGDLRAKVRHAAHLAGMIVAADHRGHGLGGTLLDHAIAALRALDRITLVTLTVTAGNDSAVRLYENRGFVGCGSLPRAIRVEGIYFAKQQMALLL